MVTESDLFQCFCFAAGGFSFGCFLAVLFWIFPLPIIAFVGFFDLTGLFADYMYMAFPLLALLPVVFCWFGWRFGQSR